MGSSEGTHADLKGFSFSGWQHFDGPCVKVLRERYRDKVDFNDQELVASWQREVIQCIMQVHDPHKDRASVLICALTLDLTDCCGVMDAEVEADPEALSTVVPGSKPSTCAACRRSFQVAGPRSMDTE